MERLEYHIEKGEREFNTTDLHTINRDGSELVSAVYDGAFMTAHYGFITSNAQQV